MTYIVRFEELNLLVELEQNYIHLGNKRSEEDRKRLEEWTERHMIPDILKHKIMQIVGENLKKDIYFNLENIFLLLPPELQKDVKRHLCLDMLKKVSSSGPIYFLYNIFPMHA